MGRRIVFLPPDSASLMRYIYLKLRISSPCQGRRGRRALSWFVWGSQRRAAHGGPRSLAGPLCPPPARCPLSAALTMGCCAPAPPDRPDLSTALWLPVLAFPPASPASWLSAPLVSAGPGPPRESTSRSGHRHHHYCVPRPRAEPEGRPGLVPRLFCFSLYLF